jgi:galactose-1-phosphate uridylyltransferase
MWDISYVAMTNANNVGKMDMYDILHKCENCGKEYKWNKWYEAHNFGLCRICYESVRMGQNGQMKQPYDSTVKASQYLVKLKTINAIADKAIKNNPPKELAKLLSEIWDESNVP